MHVAIIVLNLAIKILPTSNVYSLKMSKNIYTRNSFNLYDIPILIMRSTTVIDNVFQAPKVDKIKL